MILLIIVTSEYGVVATLARQLIALMGHGLSIAVNFEVFILDERNSVKDILLQRSVHSRHSLVYSSGLLSSFSTGINSSTECSNSYMFQKCIARVDTNE